MNLEVSYDKTETLYKEHLNLIKGIKFTYREIDIIACIVHNRGEKKIALLLSLSPRTVGTHIHNIMLKLNCNSREYIVDFIEKSGKLFFLRQYYFCLLLHLLFKTQLKKVAKEHNKQAVKVYIKYDQLNPKENNLLKQLKEHLKLTNIILVDNSELNDGNKVDFYVVTKEFSNKKKLLAKNFLLFNNKYSNKQNIIKQNIDFSKKEEYYFLIFELLERIIKPNLINPIKQEFKEEYDAILNSWASGKKPGEIKNIFSLLKENLLNSNFNILLICLGIIFLLLLTIQRSLPTYKEIKAENVNCDLPIPHDSILLDRESILVNIDKKLKGDGIKVVALVGSGGSGKTTTARQYARNQKIPFVWEINAETKDTTLSSFEQLAYALCQTEEDKQEVQMIQKMKDMSDREGKLYVFLAKKARSYDNWLMIYNNVEAFENIKRYFPYDPQVWGNGKVIITTCNTNISHNNHIPGNNVIKIEELSEADKLMLFSKIINNGKDYLASQKPIVIEFLKKIPPFPLDVALAAYYIKEENVSYDEYLNYLDELREEFVSVQGTILKDLGEYNKTRYDIVTLSIKRIIEVNPEFADLLLLIGTISPQNIPKDLLVKYKGDITVSKFMHEVRKFSLITEKPQDFNIIPVFSIHQDTQKITLAYLCKLFNPQKAINQLTNIANVLAEYAAKELEESQSFKVPLFISHAETFLSHTELLTKTNISNLDIQLGIYYFDNAMYKKAQILFEQALKVYNNQYGQDHVKTAWVLTRLGVVYRNMQNYKKARELLEQAWKIYRKKHGDDCSETAWVATYLGSIYTNIGEYEKAKPLFDKALDIYKKDPEGSYIKIVWVSAYLGNLYKHLGDYKNAKILLDKVLTAYKNQFGINHPRIAWVATCLASVYENTGNYEKAKELMEQSLSIYNKLYGEYCIETAWVLTHLGSVYYHMGNNTKAIELLEQSLKIYYLYFDDNHTNIAWVKLVLANANYSLKNYHRSQELLKQVDKIYQQYYGKNHIQTAFVLNSFGKLKIANKDFTGAEDLINEALNIFQQNQHPQAYTSLEMLADLYIIKAEQVLNKGNISECKLFKESANNNYKKALNIIEAYSIGKNTQLSTIRHKLERLCN